MTSDVFLTGEKKTAGCVGSRKAAIWAVDIKYSNKYTVMD